MSNIDCPYQEDFQKFHCFLDFVVCYFKLSLFSFFDLCYILAFCYECKLNLNLANTKGIKIFLELMLHSFTYYIVLTFFN